MPASANKKAILRRFEKEPLSGYVDPASFLQPGGVELLSAEGRVSLVPYSDVKTVAFVRDFDATPPAAQRVFHTRPKMAGVWISLVFRDGDKLEGILPNDLLQVEAQGFLLVPPDPAGNDQRIFTPRAALLSAQVLGVIGSPLRRRPKPESHEQIGLFDES